MTRKCPPPSHYCLRCVKLEDFENPAMFLPSCLRSICYTTSLRSLVVYAVAAISCHTCMNPTKPERLPSTFFPTATARTTVNAPDIDFQGFGVRSQITHLELG